MTGLGKAQGKEWEGNTGALRNISGLDDPTPEEDDDKSEVN